MNQILKTILHITASIFLSATLIFAQTNSPITAEQRKQANEFMQAENWEKVAELYEIISQAEPKSAGVSFRLGVAYHRLKNYEKAITAYENAEKIQSNPQVAYNLACVYAIQNNQAKAFVWLEKAISAGFTNLAEFQTDPDLNGLRKSNEYKLLEEKLEKAVSPCKYNLLARQFDFWVGDWDVKNQQGQNAGKNTIQKLENDCLLLENWTSVNGNTGKSINFFDTEINKWRQIWVESNGDSTLYVGEFKEGSMRYEAVKIGKDGKKTLSRMIFTPLDKIHVRQLGEDSVDDGKTWTTSFDLVYILK